MRSYATLRSTFWTRGSGKKLRGNPIAQVLAAYLITCGHGTVCGIFSLALPTIAHETGLPLEALPGALAAVSEIAQYDAEEELCWVPNSAREQLGQTLSSGDKRRKALEVELRQFGEHPFVAAFYELYTEAYGLTVPRNIRNNSRESGHVGNNLEGASEVLGRGFEGASVQQEAPSTVHVQVQHSTSTGSGSVQVGGAGGAGDAPSPNVAPGRGPAKPRGSRRAPPEWAPNAEHQRLAAEQRKDVGRELERFRDHEFPRPYTDWDATFRNWLRSDRGGQQPKVPIFDPMARAMMLRAEQDVIDAAERAAGDSP